MSGVWGPKPPEADESSTLLYYSRELILTIVTHLMVAYVYEKKLEFGMHKLSNLNLQVFSLKTLKTGKFYSFYMPDFSMYCIKQSNFSLLSINTSPFALGQSCVHGVSATVAQRTALSAI